MKKILYSTIQRIAVLIGFLFFISQSYAVDKNISVYVGESFAVSPWGDVSSSYSGYTCSFTNCVASDKSAANSLTIKERIRTTTKYTNENGSWADGFYASYTVTALQTGVYILYGYVTCHKDEFFKHYVGSPVVTYRVEVKEKPKVVSISIPGSLTLKVGDTYTFSPVIAESGASTTLKWSSSNTSVVSINTSGKITAKSPGSSTIKCTADNGVSAQCVITVNPILVSKITLDKNEIDLYEGENTTLIATVSPTNATNKDVEWSSTNNAVAIVGSTGTVVAVSEGNCFITVSAKDGSGKKTDCLVHVKKKDIKIQSITLNPSSVNLHINEAIILSAIILPENASAKTLSWQSSNAAIASVDSNGKVNAIAVGDATITATANDGSGVTASCKITVSPVLIQSITISPSSKSLKVGEVATLTAIILPQEAANNGITWTSSNKNVATVDVNGKVKAIAVGDATITATANDGSGVTASCKITVSPILINSIIVSPNNASLKVGESIKLEASVLPDNATNPSLSWSSSNIAVAKVSNDGIVTAVSAGNATIIASATDGSSQHATCSLSVSEEENKDIFQFEYNTESKEASLIACNSKIIDNVVVPSTTIHEGIEYSVTSIGDYCFYALDNLKSVELPSTLKKIGKYCFAYNYDLSYVNLGNSLEEIGDWAFSSCSSLTSINLPNSLKEIGYEAFSSTSLISVILPNSIKEIKPNTFSHCCNLEYIYIPNNVVSIGSYAFGSCEKLSSINIPNTVNKIGSSAFMSCSNITSITIPNSVSKIEETTFWHCNSLKTVIIPETITSIGGGAFMDCSSLESIHIPESVIDFGWGSTFEDCTNLTSINLPRSTTKICRAMFSGCTNLTSINLPSMILEIGALAFKGCNNLAQITCEAETPPSVSAFYGNDEFALEVGSENAFDHGIYSSAILYVPNSSVELYKNADVWALFNNIRPIDESSSISNYCIEDTHDVSIHDLSGRLYPSLRNGFNIISRNGATKKVLK